MTDSSRAHEPLTILQARHSLHGARDARRLEPVCVGIPLPAGVCQDPTDLGLTDDAGTAVPVQVRVLDTWPDGSLRWALVDLQANCPGRYTLHVQRNHPPIPPPVAVRTTRAQNGFDVDTGIARFHVPDSGDCLLEEVSGGGVGRRVVLRVTDAEGRAVTPRVSHISEETNGPLRTTLYAEGIIGSAEQVPLRFSTRLHFFSACCAVQIEVTVHNPRRAAHAGGFWDLGDEGSVLFQDISLRLQMAGTITKVQCVPESGSSPIMVPVPVSLYQASSGGENWTSTNHVNREGHVPLEFRGYRLDAAGFTAAGLRATPVLIARHEGGTTAVAVRHFWQNFPKALEADGDGLTIRLFPRQFPDLHELQGGEQKTHCVGLSFGTDTIGDIALNWILDPTIVSAAPSWYARCAAVAHLTPESEDPNDGYIGLVRAAIDGPDTFERKRERIDEYGWRNFGDIYADHEAMGQTAGQPLISHYNNQYDAIAGFGVQFMRSGDLRWWTAMMELAAHVLDIDLYRTREDKAAYNGGLFWHTFHYKDAGRSTHRAYPRADGVGGGGCSNEHDYSTGLMLHHFLTGSAASREAVIQLAEWVMAMDDGRHTVFGWLSRADTGLASATVVPQYHGPGRGAGNSITTLLNGHRLTQNQRYLQKAQVLIQRCIHPADDIEQRNLLDAERRWSYTVFLQALGRFLDDKILRNELDWCYAFARASMLHYARWMAAHEYPYLEKPEILEYPTETWAAQDIRKSEVFQHAAKHASEAERTRFLERAAFFFRTSIDTLRGSPTRTLARPVVLLLSYGHMFASVRRAAGPAPEGPTDCEFGSPVRFVPQKDIAMRRAITLGAAVLVIALLLLTWELS